MSKKANKIDYLVPKEILESGRQGYTGGRLDGDQPEGEVLQTEARGVGHDHLGGEEREGGLDTSLQGTNREGEDELSDLVPDVFSTGGQERDKK
jgi:hypothetical protein